MNPLDPRLELIRRCLDGDASPADRAALETALRRDAELRLTYLRYLNVCKAVEARDDLLTDEVPEPSRQWVRWAAGAAATAALCLLAFGLSTVGPSRASDYVATLTLADDCVWEDKNERPEGLRVKPGNLHLRSGTAMVRFDSGADLLLRGPAELRIMSRSRAALLQGEALIRAEGDAAGFQMETPASQVTDLGTEFKVKVESNGATEVHVQEGLVAYRKPEANADEGPTGDVLLTAGKAVRYDEPKQASPREVGLATDRFDKAVRQALATRTAKKMIAHEPFRYEKAIVPLTEASGGYGWSGPWEAAGLWPRPTDPQRPLSFLDDPGSETGRLLDAGNKFPQISRKLAEPIRMDRDGVHYFSIRMKWTPGSSPVPQMRQVRVALRSSTQPKQGRYTLNMPVCLRPQIQRHDLEVFTSRETLPAGKVQLWVLKIVTRRNGDDELYLRVFNQGENPGAIEPEKWNLALTHEKCDATLDQVVLDTYLSPDAAAFGDIRLGRSWRDVVSAQNP